MYKSPYIVLRSFGGERMGNNIIKWCFICFMAFFIPYALTAIISGAPISVEEDGGNIVATDDDKTEQNGSYSLEQYLMAAMAANTSPEYTIETLKAQAVVLRTMVYYRMNELEKEGGKEPLTLANLGIDTMSMEELKNSYSEEEYNTFVSHIENAVYATEGQILTYNGKPIKAYFHYSNGGQTRDYEEAYGDPIPYLLSVKSSWDVEASTAVKSTEFERNDAITLLKENYQINTLTEENFFEQVTVSSRDQAGYVKELKIGDATITGEEFADSFALNSTNFYLDNYNGKLRVVCKGKGNGLGFSQYGANCMAKEGKTYDGLLSYYFQNTQLSKIQS